MKNYLKNKKLLEDNYIYNSSQEHDACGVGLIASLDGKKKREVVKTYTHHHDFFDYTRAVIHY